LHNADANDDVVYLEWAAVGLAEEIFSLRDTVLFQVREFLFTGVDQVVIPGTNSFSGMSYTRAKMAV